MNLVFAYGSLIDRFPDAFKGNGLFVGEYVIDDTNIFVSLVPSDKSHSTEGVFLSLTDEEFNEADEYEDIPNTFHREKKTILTEDLDEIEAWVYFLTEKQKPVSFEGNISKS